VTTELELTPFQSLLKRTLDVVLSAAILLFLAPLLIIVSILIKLEGPGPILNKQRRFGPDGSEVTIRKFRTMRIDADGDAIVRQATKLDSRITRVGQFLRRTALDEIPALISVLRGDMTLVGPRPKHAAEYDYYKSVATAVLHTKPGITSMSRVLGYEYGTPDAETLRLLYDSDKKYVQGWSIWLDLKIIGQTFVRAFTSSNRCACL
jgi:putative colanic acid biosynthesis UDP-glucose lipid carrier transferase